MITVQTSVHASIEKVWECWTDAKHITKWYQASDDWHAPHAENDLKAGGRFKIRMEAKDGSFGFDLEGIYSTVVIHKQIDYDLADARKVKTSFERLGKEVKVTQSFDPETENSEELQRGGWQAILDSFKKHAESVS